MLEQTINDSVAPLHGRDFSKEHLEHTINYSVVPIQECDFSKKHSF